MKNLDDPSMPQPLMRDIEGDVCTALDIYDHRSGFTKREQACIQLGIPETGDEELDAIIRKSERKRIASLCLAAWIQHHGSNGEYGYSSEQAAESAACDADALLSKLGEDIL